MANKALQHISRASVYVAVILSGYSLLNPDCAEAQLRELGPLHHAPQGESAPEFGLPLACEIGQTCFVFSYPDHDPTHGWHDYRCNPQSYDGNSGIEFGVATESRMRAGIPVLAAAGGVVRSVRTAMPDLGARNQAATEFEGKEAGNGVYIDHGNGWSSLYGHLMQGSILVERGQRITGGQIIGLMGLSGDTDYPHLHFGVLFNSRPVDPFAIRPVTCAGPEVEIDNQEKSIWNQAARQQLAYHRTQLIGYGFLNRPVTTEDLFVSQQPVSTASDLSEALTLYADFIGLKKGDGFQLRILSPFGDLLVEREWQFDKPKRRHIGIVGRLRPEARWQEGTWFGEISVWRIEDGVNQQVFFRRVKLQIEAAKLQRQP